jgi:hypothetical protein
LYVWYITTILFFIVLYSYATRTTYEHYP